MRTAMLASVLALVCALASACQGEPDTFGACEIRANALCDLNATCYGWSDEQTAQCFDLAIEHCGEYRDEDRAYTCAVKLWDNGCPDVESWDLDRYPDECR